MPESSPPRHWTPCVTDLLHLVASDRIGPIAWTGHSHGFASKLAPLISFLPCCGVSCWGSSFSPRDRSASGHPNTPGGRFEFSATSPSPAGSRGSVGGLPASTGRSQAFALSLRIFVGECDQQERLLSANLFPFSGKNGILAESPRMPNCCRKLDPGRRSSLDFSRMVAKSRQPADPRTVQQSSTVWGHRHPSCPAHTIVRLFLPFLLVEVRTGAPRFLAATRASHTLALAPGIITLRPGGRRVPPDGAPWERPTQGRACMRVDQARMAPQTMFQGSMVSGAGPVSMAGLGESPRADQGDVKEVEVRICPAW